MFWTSWRSYDNDQWSPIWGLEWLRISTWWLKTAIKLRSLVGWCKFGLVWIDINIGENISHIAKTLGSMSVGFRCGTKVTDRHPIDVDLMIFAIWVWYFIFYSTVMITHIDRVLIRNVVWETVFIDKTSLSWGCLLCKIYLIFNICEDVCYIETDFIVALWYRCICMQ